MKWAVTFGQRYAYEKHPASDRITDRTFVVFEGTEMEVRQQAHLHFLGQWAFLYPYSYTEFDGTEYLSREFQEQIKRYGLVRLEIDEVRNGEV